MHVDMMIAADMRQLSTDEVLTSCGWPRTLQYAWVSTDEVLESRGFPRYSDALCV
jgi:hypothetical protein